MKKFRNFYECPYDGAKWIDEWDCTSNDRCPVCGAEIEPHESEDIWPDAALQPRQ